MRVSHELTVPALVKRSTVCCCIQRRCAGSFSGLRRVGVLPLLYAGGSSELTARQNIYRNDRVRGMGFSAKHLQNR